jgi:hypothetical protein
MNFCWGAMKAFFAKAFMGPFVVLYGGLIFLAVYGLYDLASKRLFSLFFVGILFAPYALIQGLGALLGWW